MRTPLAVIARIDECRALDNLIHGDGRRNDVSERDISAPRIFRGFSLAIVRKAVNTYYKYHLKRGYSYDAPATATHPATMATANVLGRDMR